MVQTVPVWCLVCIVLILSSPLLPFSFFLSQLHLDSRIDDSLAGTTAITILFQGRKMSVCNVGDSRAIVISRVKQDGKSRLVARALSADQTPYRKDERERIKQYVVILYTALFLSHTH